MRLEARLIKRLPQFTIDVAFHCRGGELLAFVGPSGAGKTSIVRMIAGLERPDVGTIRLDGSTWVDTEAGISLPSRRRRLGYVFQEHTLFPHLTIEKNVAFAADNRNNVIELLRLFGIEKLADRRPHQVSGGERQRAALAQALARNPKLLLLDEPFSALDVLTRKYLRRELKAIKESLGIPILHVTHDLDEAMYLADHVVPIEQGVIQRDWLIRTAAAEEPAVPCRTAAPVSC